MRTLPHYALAARAACLALTLGACGSDEGPNTIDPVFADAGGDNGSASGGNGTGTAGTGGSGGATATSSGTANTGGPVTSGPDEPVYLNACGSGAAGLSDAELATLKAGGNAGSARLLYPYDGTVFPRGLEGPLLMWDGVASPQAVYVHIKSRAFEYEGCLTPSAEGQLQLPQDVWEQAGAKTFGKGDPYSVQVSWLSGGQAVGPVSQSWTLAQATIKGSVYYNSYTSLQIGAPGGKVFRIPPGGQAEPFVALECNGCHSVSANGARMTSQTLGLGGRTYDLQSGTAQQLAAPATTPYAALYPDGSRYVSNSLATEVARSVLTSATALAGGMSPDALLYDTDTGQQIPSEGIPPGALMPSFSSDGRFLVFNDYALGNASGLAMVAFDAATNVASNYQVLYEDPQMRPGWPFLLPDNQAVVFVRTDGIAFSGNGAGVAGQIGNIVAPYSELFMTDVDTGATTLLARAMGYASEADAAAGKTYLPFGDQDIRRVYFPTVSPVAAGGYFWVFFDAIRHYGNRGQQRQLWGTAIEISPDGDYSVDRSSPAFYLPGQEFGTGNHRAFTALDPCKEDGASCTSGVDCCGGFCTFPEGEFGIGEGVCSSDPNTCARTDERCEIDADCCDPEAGEASNVCIAGYCAPVPIL